MKVVIEIELGNDAMRSGGDVARTLRGLAAQLANFGRKRPGVGYVLHIPDDNGNTVGFLKVVEG